MLAVDSIPGFASRLNLKAETISRAIEMAIGLRGKQVVCGKNPKTIAASILYLASKEMDEPRTQRDVANATGVIEVTIRKRSEEIDI